MMPDHEFAKCLIMNMSQSEKWQFCRDHLLEEMTKSEQGGVPLNSMFVLARAPPTRRHAKGLFTTATNASTSKARADDDGGAA
ncbi:hypothetical protein R3P38DRAFT_3140174 [Favolaschia claudopus]|uniref:Uncharacterized protein n=1 Tax=Favolaschia claudopus TaxID=2862362 RepID=A0AAV9Z684_9AGAR